VLLQKLYVGRSARRQGLGSRLVARVETEAIERGATAIELWTDTRFEPAHRLYERLGYVRNGATRELHDLSNSVEYHYLKELQHG
jgi:putative acetyltransferase